MSESLPAEAAAPAEPASEEKPKKKQDSFAVFLVKLVVAVLLFRTLLFTSFMIPSESMMPRLLVGDYLFAAKWPYGYSRASLPFDPDIAPHGRLFGSLPERGDVVIFKHPVDRTDYVKRVIGLPGDTVQMVAGQIVLNGTPVPKRRIADFVLPQRVRDSCRGVSEHHDDGTFACRYPRYRETLPGGVSYEVLDIGAFSQDTTEPVVVPDGPVFLLGDKRDNSMDSRYPAVAGEGIGLVPVDNLAARASFMFFSTSSAWNEPSTWLSGIRWSRMGRGI
jgi:signal peptidase I